VEVLLCYIMPKPGKGLTELATGKSINYSDPLYLIFLTVMLKYQEIFFFDSLFYNIVMYSGSSIHDGTLLHSKSQYTTVKHSRNSWNTCTRLTCMVPEHSFL
jgi:hypothetical protein